MAEEVIIEHDDGLVVVTINRPEQRNAVNRAVSYGVCEAIDELDRRKIDIWVFYGNEWLLTNPDGAYVAHEQMTIRYAPRVVSDFSPYLDGVTKIVGSGTDPGALIQASMALQNMLGDRASIALSQAYYLDITDKLANKGTAVTVHAEMLGITTDQIATIGDMENDVRMFEKSGFSVAMGNASPEVQARASVVTASNEENGFAQAVERFILPRAPARPRRPGRQPAERGPHAGRGLDSVGELSRMGRCESDDRRRRRGG